VEEKSRKFIEDQQKRLEVEAASRQAAEQQVRELQRQMSSLKAQLNTSQETQKDFVELSQSLQVCCLGTSVYLPLICTRTILCVVVLPSLADHQSLNCRSSWHKWRSSGQALNSLLRTPHPSRNGLCVTSALMICGNAFSLHEQQLF